MFSKPKYWQNIAINNLPFSPQKPLNPPNYMKKTPWKRNTCLVVGDSTMNGIQVDKMSSDQMINVRVFPRACVTYFYDLIEPFYGEKTLQVNYSYENE